MPDVDDSVNRLIVYLGKAKKVHEERGNHERAIEMARHEQDLKGLLLDYKRLEDLTHPIPIFDGDDLSDLPPELRSELSVTKTDELEEQIVTIVNAAGGQADIDTILIYLYRRFEVIQTRRYLQNKLWRMAQKKFLHTVPRKKGHYSTHPQTEVVDTPSDKKASSEVMIDDTDDDIPF